MLQLIYAVLYIGLLTSPSFASDGDLQVAVDYLNACNVAEDSSSTPIAHQKLYAESGSLGIHQEAKDEGGYFLYAPQLSGANPSRQFVVVQMDQLRSFTIRLGKYVEFACRASGCVIIQFRVKQAHFNPNDIFDTEREGPLETRRFNDFEWSDCDSRSIRRSAPHFARFLIGRGFTLESEDSSSGYLRLVKPR